MRHIIIRVPHNTVCHFVTKIGTSCPIGEHIADLDWLWTYYSMTTAVEADHWWKLWTLAYSECKDLHSARILYCSWVSFSVPVHVVSCCPSLHPTHSPDLFELSTEWTKGATVAVKLVVTNFVYIDIGHWSLLHGLWLHTTHTSRQSRADWYGLTVRPTGVHILLVSSPVLCYICEPMVD